jgi:hypothetical protein
LTSTVVVVGAYVPLHQQPAADLQGHPGIRVLGMRRLERDFIFHPQHPGRFSTVSAARGLVILVLHRAAEGDHAILRLHVHVIGEHRAIIVGGLGGGLDLAIGFGGSQQRERAGEEKQEN